MSTFEIVAASIVAIAVAVLLCICIAYFIVLFVRKLAAAPRGGGGGLRLTSISLVDKMTALPVKGARVA